MVDILHAVSVRAPAGAVYDALTSREGLAGWWTEETTTSLTDAGEKLHSVSADAASSTWT